MMALGLRLENKSSIVWAGKVVGLYICENRLDMLESSIYRSMKLKKSVVREIRHERTVHTE
jgi:hypothetical protein